MTPNEETIRLTLEQLVSELSVGKIEQARTTLKALEFGRLAKPMHDPSTGGSRLFTSPSRIFGEDRVADVWQHLQQASAAIAQGDATTALDAATQALNRWRSWR